MFSMSMSSLFVVLGISGSEGIVPEVVASFVSLLKCASYNLLALLDSFRGIWYNSTKCWGVQHFLEKWFGPPYLCHLKALPFP
jgi:hypothetical protein